MRGKPAVSFGAPINVRITPAHAGKTYPARRLCRLQADHPRACGENFNLIDRCLIDNGSPPRMRGKHPHPFPRRCTARITPAHAGKTLCEAPPAGAVPDHPRACGENRFLVQNTNSTCGSPPRMRGKLNERTNHLLHLRITPAHAGKTKCRLQSQGAAADHPRACGENMQGANAETNASGSPPRMRGKPKS